MDDQLERVEAKLDQILSILHGDGREEMGIIQKVNLLWLIVYKWPLYLISIIFGAGLTLVIQFLGQ